jgi:DNA-binding NarL/FixJ family response regulator
MKINIAVVDDHILFRTGVVSLLKDHERIQVTIQASNGKELLSTLKQYALPHIVLLDIQMPEMNGIQTTQALKELYPDIKIIILTMHNEDEFIYDLMSKGANGFIPKNKSVDTLLEAINSVMERGYYYNDQITEALIKGNNGNIKALEHLSEASLTDREIEVVKLICAQKSNKEIAEILDISPRTVDTHKNNIFLKTGAKNVIGVALYAVQSKLIS